MQFFAWTDTLGYIAAGAVFVSFSMKNMQALRIVALVSNVAFISYALVDGLTPILVLHGLLLPLNLLRLVQMLRAVREAEHAVAERSNFEWLIAQGERLTLETGEVLFRTGDEADAMFVVAEGELEVVEYGAVLSRGDLLGEIGLFSRERRRTATIRARTPATLARITGKRVKSLHFDNPGFAYHLTRVVADRLIEDVRMEKSGKAANRQGFADCSD